MIDLSLFDDMAWPDPDGDAASDDGPSGQLDLPFPRQPRFQRHEAILDTPFDMRMHSVSYHDLASGAVLTFRVRLLED